MFRIEQRDGHILLYSGTPVLRQEGRGARDVYQSALLAESDEEVLSDDDPAESFLAWLFSVFSEPLSEPLEEDVLA
jgi:hypothetical protein